MADAVLTVDYNPHCMLLDGTTLYVGGHKKLGMSYPPDHYTVIAAYDVSTLPITLLYQKDQDIQPEIPGVFYPAYKEIKKSGSYLYIAGAKTSPIGGGRLIAVVKKVLASDPDTVSWEFSYDPYLPAGSADGTFLGLALDGADIYAVGINLTPSGGDYYTVKLQDNGVTVTQVWELHGDIAGFSYNDVKVYDATYIDCFGQVSPASTWIVNRRRKSDGFPISWASPASPGNTSFRFNKGTTDGSFYYQAGSVFGVGPDYRRDLMVLDTVTLSRQQEKTWSDASPSTAGEDAYIVVTDGSDFYIMGTFLNTGITTTTISKINNSWPPLTEDWVIYEPGIGCIYALAVGSYLWDGVGFEPTFPSPTIGYIECRSKVDGSLIPIPSGPTMDALMRNGKWFSGGVFQGFWLGWR